MTFDLKEEKRLMLERFQKGEGFKMFAPGDGIYRDTASMRTLEDSWKAREAGNTEAADKLLQEYNDNAESLYDAKETYRPDIFEDNGQLVLGKPIKAPGRPDAIATEYNKEGIYWDHPMMRRGAVQARGAAPANAEDLAIKQQNKKAGRSKRDLDTAVTEVALGENPEYDALPPGRSIDAFIKQVIGHMQTGMSFEDAINVAAEDMAGRPLKKSFDINAAMSAYSQDYDADPIKRSVYEPFRRMGLFGLGKKKVPASEPAPVKAMPKPVKAGATPETDEEKAAREADEAAFQAAKAQ